MAEREAERTRRQLAKHAYRMRERAGCTFEEIARALKCSVAEAVQGVDEVTPRRATLFVIPKKD